MALLGAAGIFFGCGESVPEEPTWFGDVQPIINANCKRCHGADPFLNFEARLDRYVQNDDESLDAYDYRAEIVERAVHRMDMPLDYKLYERQREILLRWVEQGAPKGSRENASPQAVAVSPPDASLTIDQVLDLTLRSWDDDGDGLVVAIGAREAGGGEGAVLATDLGAGTRQVELDTAQLASERTFEIFAVVDDGFSDDPAENQHEVVLLSDVFVDHGERGTAPTVVLMEPNGDASVIGETAIVWSASDPDPGDVLTFDLDLIRVESGGDEVVAQIASDLPDDARSFLWDASDVPDRDDDGDLIQYKVRVTATDAGAKNTRSDESDEPFAVAQAGETSLGWDDVRPTFVTYCIECHGEPAANAKIEDFRLDKYDANDPEPPENSDLGVFEMRQVVYERLVAKGSMPPAAEPQPSADEVAAIGEWILAGAPEGSGGGDGAPTFTWSTPNDSAITETATGDVTLSWSASDPEGLPLTGSISYVELSAPSDAQAQCDASLTGWIELPDAGVTSGSYAFTAPNEGYFCLRAEVTDDAGQTTTAIAARPISYSTTPGP